MAKPITLKRNNQFLSAYKRGKSSVSPVLITYLIKNRTGKNRIGITTSKKVGNAVKRNRARRIILAAYREHNPYLKKGWDIVFVARSKTPEVKTQDISYVMKKHLSHIKEQ